MSLRDRQNYFADFVGMPRHAYVTSATPFRLWFQYTAAVRFLLPLPKCFLKICLPTLPAAVLNFLTLTTSAFRGTTKSRKSAITLFAAGQKVQYFMLCPVVILCPALWLEIKGSQHRRFCVTKDFVLNQVCVYQERVLAVNVVCKLWFFSCEHHSIFIANKASKMCLSPYWRKQDQIPPLRNKFWFFAFFGIVRLWCSFCCDCVLLERA